MHVTWMVTVNKYQTLFPTKPTRRVLLQNLIPNTKPFDKNLSETPHPSENKTKELGNFHLPASMWRGTCSSQTGRWRTHRGFMSFGQQLFHQFLTFLDVWWRLTLMDLEKSAVPPLTHRKCWSRWYLESITWSESTSTSMIEVKLSYLRYSTPQTGLMLILHFDKRCNLEKISLEGCQILAFPSPKPNGVRTSTSNLHPVKLTAGTQKLVLSMMFLLFQARQHHFWGSSR